MSTMGYVSTLTGADETASLNLDFKNQKYKVDGVTKQFSDLITFTRASGGGRFNAAGQYEWLANDQPRFDYDPITKVLKGILIEEARTNLLLRSSEFDAATWTKLELTVAPNYSTAPDGTFTSDKLTSTGVGTFSYVLQAASASSTVTYSVYVKKEVTDAVAFRVVGTDIGGAGNTDSFYTYTFSTNTIARNSGGTASSTSAVSANDGWVRVVLTFTSATVTSAGVYTNRGSSGVNSVVVWGAQLEVGAFATSYIPTPSTFTSRASTGTYFDSNGILQTAAINIPRIDYEPVSKISKGMLVESAATNLLTYSDQIGSIVWTKDALNPVIRSTDPDPAGGLNARVIRPLAGTGVVGRVLRNFSAVSGTSYTFSIFAKKKEIGFMRMLSSGASGATQEAFYDLTLATSGNIAGGCTTTSVNVGNGWVRCSISFTASLTATGTFYAQAATSMGVGAYTGDGTPSLLMAFGQVEVGAVPTSYIPTPATFTSRASTATYFDATGTLQTAATNVARSDAYMRDETGVNRPIGLMLEGAGTNLATYSNDLGNAIWPKINSTVNTSSTISPDGLMNADVVVENTSATNHGFYRDLTVVSGTSYTVSFFVKAAGRSRVRLRLGQAGGVNGTIIGDANFDLDANAFISGSATSPTITDVGNGWKRISATVVAASTTLGITVLFIDTGTNVSYTADGVSALAFFGMSVEAGTVATSYIPTPSTFTSRASTATYIDSAGVMKTAVTNEARSNAYGYDSTGVLKPIGLLLENAATNLLLMSSELDGGYWVKYVDGTATTVVVPNSATAPDGTLTADKVSFTATGNNLITQNATVTASVDVTLSVWMKGSLGGEQISISLRNTTSAGLFGATFTLTTDWARYSVKVTNDATTAKGFQFRKEPGTSAVADVCIWGAQLEVGSYPTSYVPTPSTFTSRASTATYFDANGVMQTAAINAARSSAYGYDSAGALKPIGLLLEPAATNLLTYSEDFTNAAWTKNQITAAPGGGVSPNGGTMTTFTLTGTGAYLRHSGTVTAGATFTVSMFVKRGSFDWILLNACSDSGANNGARGWFNLATGTKGAVQKLGSGTIGTSEIEYTGSGIYRISVTTAVPAATFAYAIVTPSDADLSVIRPPIGTYIHTWGAQVEAGAFATSYIPTVAATVTRSADVSSSVAATRAADISTSVATTRADEISSSVATTRAADVTSSVAVTRDKDMALVNQLDPWYNPVAGTFYADYNPGQIGYGGTCVALYASSSNPAYNLIILRNGTAQGAIVGVAANSAGATQAAMTGANGVPIGVNVRAAMTIATNDAAISVNGGAVVTDTALEMPVPTRFAIGAATSSQQHANGHVKAIRYYNRRMSNSELQALTI